MKKRQLEEKCESAVCNKNLSFIWIFIDIPHVSSFELIHFAR